MNIAGLGLGQLVNWGVLYYAFAVLLQPVQRELARPAWVVAGAFSLALLVSALLAPTVGRVSDRGYAPLVMGLGGIAAACLMGVWAFLPGLLAMYVVWAGLGVCMAMVLYEPAFAIVTRAHASAEQRLRALAVITVFGGLASTVFLPLTSALVTMVGWRATVVALAVLLAVSAGLTRVSAAGMRGTGASYAPRAVTQSRHEALTGLGFLSVVFGLSSLATASFVANLVPALGERGVQPAMAAILGGAFGVMQLPGRALMVSRRVTLGGHMLLALSLVLQALGLVAVATAPFRLGVALGVMTFAAGSGLTILARPHLVQAEYAVEHAGLVNGRLARAQQFTRALGPIAAAGAAGVSSYAIVLVVLAAALGLSAWLVVRPRNQSSRHQEMSESGNRS